MAVGKAQQSLMYLGGRFGEFYEANKPHIYTGIGIGGTVLTGILAAQSGARSARKIDRREKELGRRLTFLEKSKLCWTDAIAPVAVCAISGYSTFKVDRTLSAELAKRTTMLIASEKAYEKLSQKTKEVLGEKKAKQIQDEVVKDKVQTAVQNGVISIDDFNNAPRVGNGQLSMFVDEYTMLPFWSNIDYISLQVAELQNMMNDLAPRNPDNDYSNKEVGVHFTEWLHRIGYTNPDVQARIVKTPERKHLGWNKGFAGKHGVDDDVIDFYRTPIEWSPGVSVTAIGFNTEPTDMRMGRLIKTSGLG
jgi:hypothetical protein